LKGKPKGKGQAVGLPIKIENRYVDVAGNSREVKIKWWSGDDRRKRLKRDRGGGFSRAAKEGEERRGDDKDQFKHRRIRNHKHRGSGESRGLRIHQEAMVPDSSTSRSGDSKVQRKRELLIPKDPDGRQVRMSHDCKYENVKRV